MQTIALTGTDSKKEAAWAVQEYALDSTLTSGQAFRWQYRDGWWFGVLRSRWVRLQHCNGNVRAQTAAPVENWDWLADYLQIRVDLPRVIASFPDDDAMRASLGACRGLRLLRQDPWECLSSFILSSTKQIVQIQQIISLLCERFGEPVMVPPGYPPAYSFPSAARISGLSENELRECKMGFRAPYLRGAAELIARGEIDLNRLWNLELPEARQALLGLPGVGRKIADCVLLFAYGFQEAFPVDVWVMKALRQLYFPNRRVNRKRLERFTASYFGPHAGYAQQYLFHYMRTQVNPKSETLKVSRRTHEEKH